MQQIHRRLSALPNDHPLYIALRTYSLALSFTLGPSLLSLLSSKRTRSLDILLARGWAIIRRELALTSFPFAITVAVSGGAALQSACKIALEDEKGVNYTSLVGQRANAHIQALRARLLRVSPEDRALFCNAISSLLSIALLQSRRRLTRSTPLLSGRDWKLPLDGSKRVSPTLDLTLLFVVRALDALVQRGLFGRQEDESAHARDTRRRITTKLDAMVFWACSARIMWCFFYEPSRLPRSYVKWITSLANIDRRLISALQAIREGQWSYVQGHVPEPHALATLSEDLGYPRSWATPGNVPAFGGRQALSRWNELGVQNRGPVGGIPCEIVHGTVTGSSCTKNAALRGLYAFLQAVALYLPVHFLPSLLINPRSLTSLPKVMRILAGVLRSAGFLSAFVSSIWAAVCMTRTVVLARLLPHISHDIWDGPFGCIMAGCLACGSSIWIENSRRRAEIALYVLPRAIRSCLPDRWLKSGGRGVEIVERLTYTLSLAYILTASHYHPASLRGLAKWTLAYITSGSFRWKTRAEERLNGHTVDNSDGRG